MIMNVMTMMAFNSLIRLHFLSPHNTLHRLKRQQNMWHRIGRSGSEVPFKRLLCAMAISSGTIGFMMPSDNWEKRHSSMSSSLRTRFSQLLEGRDSHTTNCESLNSWPHDESYQKMAMPERGAQDDGHVIFNLLLGEQMIERYEIFKKLAETDNENVIIAYVKFGDRIDGHPGIVHGGILSLIFDDALGFGYEALGVPMAVTANLDVDYRAPVPAGTTVRVAAQLESREGRKLFWKAQMTSIDQETLYAEATSLYIIPRAYANALENK
jgi:acyl-coenzyme A thioesterase PaaI-like protein